MNEVFREYLHRFVLVYIDDIRVYSQNKAEHRQHVFLVLSRKAEKCSFHQREIQFHQRFLGFANLYRRFIKNYSLHVAPLTSLLCSKPKSLHWSPEAVHALTALKEVFASAQVLTLPYPDKPSIVEVDASTTVAGEVLSQEHGKSLQFSNLIIVADMIY